MTEKRDERDGGIDTTRPSIARAYDVVLNGKDNFEVDRAFVAEIVKIVPEIYRNAGQCSGLQAGGEGPRGSAG